MVGGDQKDVFIGNECSAKKNMLNINHPVQNGLIENWDDMEKIWSHCFNNELRVSPDEHPVLQTESPQNPKSKREKITSIMFEKFQVP